MNTNVLIEWRDAFGSNGIRESFGRAAALARGGQRVTLVLLRDAVKAAARSENVFWFAELKRLGVEIIADLASLRAHDISAARLTRWVRPVAVSSPFDALMDEASPDWTNDGVPLHARA